MSTSNFHTANARATYVIEYEDEYIWQECQQYLGDWIRELDPAFELETSIKSKQELRDFPASSIGYWSIELTYLNITFEFRINLFVRSGYYEAANLDYESEWFIDGCDYYEDSYAVIDEISYDPTTYDIKAGIWAIHSTKLQSKLGAVESEAFEHIESLLAQVSTPYGVAAQFSNGETIYTKL